MDRITDLVSKSSRLSAGEWVLLGKMSAMLSVLLVAQRFVSLPKLMSMFDTNPSPEPTLTVTTDRLAYLVTGLVRKTLRDRYCMKRSLLLFHFLRKWGYDTQIIFGVMKDEGSNLKGHAWVELEGSPLAESGDPRSKYAVTYAYPTKE